MRAIVAGAMIACLSAGCTSTGLQQYTLNQSLSTTDMRYQQVLNDLAEVAHNNGNLPGFAVTASGTANVTNTVSIDTATLWDQAVKGFSKETLTGFGQHNPELQWTLDPAVSEPQLEGFQYACLWALLGPPPPGSREMELLREPRLEDVNGWTVGGGNLPQGPPTSGAPESAAPDASEPRDTKPGLPRIPGSSAQPLPPLPPTNASPFSRSSRVPDPSGEPRPTSVKSGRSEPEVILASYYGEPTSDSTSFSGFKVFWALNGDRLNVDLNPTNLIIVAENGKLLNFEIYDSTGKLIKKPGPESVEEVAKLKALLPNEPTYVTDETKKAEIIRRVIAITGYTLPTPPKPSSHQDVAQGPPDDCGVTVAPPKPSFHLDVARQLAALPPGWLHVGRGWHVPRNAIYKARCGDTVVWVTSEGMAGLSQFTLVMLDIATIDPTSLPIAYPRVTVNITEAPTDSDKCDADKYKNCAKEMSEKPTGVKITEVWDAGQCIIVPDPNCADPTDVKPMGKIFLSRPREFQHYSWTTPSIQKGQGTAPVGQGTPNVARPSSTAGPAPSS